MRVIFFNYNVDIDNFIWYNLKRNNKGGICMSTYKDIKEIKRVYDCGGYFSHMTIPKKLPANHIFDENISVKRNRDMVQKHNENVQKLKEEKRKQNHILAKKVSADVVDYLVGEYGFEKSQAEKLEDFVYNKCHSHMPDYFAEIDEFADVVADILNN